MEAWTPRKVKGASRAQNAAPSAPQAALTPWETRKRVQLLTLLQLHPRNDHDASRPAGSREGRHCPNVRS